MSLRHLLVPRSLLRLPCRTIRLRLTLIYASLFLVSGAGMLAVTYVLVHADTPKVLVATRPDGSSVTINRSEGPSAPGAEPDVNKAVVGGFGPVAGSFDPSNDTLTPTRLQALKAETERDQALALSQHEAELRLLLEKSGIALALMAGVSILLGWLAAGRLLRPLRTLNGRAREISATSLHKRLALAGPDDELAQLAGTFDDLLGRLEASFAAQRQFVANASHELRTPLARARTVAEVALGDPDATVDSLQSSHRRVLAAGIQQERIIEALLTLARSERGLDEHQPVDLAAVTANVLETRRPEAERRGLQIHAALQPATTSGDPELAERLVANLIDNALRHNLSHGRMDVTTTTTSSGHAHLAVCNNGPLIPPDEVERLFQPFQRLAKERTNRDGGIGIGLGLSIVAAIATAHHATITSRAQPGGGLEIEVSFPPANDANRPPPTPHRAPAPHAIPSSAA